VDTAVSAAMLILMAHTVSGQNNRPLRKAQCLTCSGSPAVRKRSASSKKAFSFCRLASIPCLTVVGLPVLFVALGVLP
jgi:hypothetical protein